MIRKIMLSVAATCMMSTATLAADPSVCVTLETVSAAPVGNEGFRTVSVTEALDGKVVLTVFSFGRRNSMTYQAVVGNGESREIYRHNLHGGKYLGTATYNAERDTVQICRTRVD
ncbi:hypothetical protein MYOV003v1_p0037 [Vibrio phage 207E48.1]|nr:hypothetical protein MYOV003v1_p0037 [Vibrio phage 207E48.1]